MSNTTNQSLESLITVLDRLVFETLHLTTCAREAIGQGERNQAIGTILPAEAKLEAANALLRTILVMHREAT
ncbi:MAG: hypothetical protein AB7E70_09585 [Hyphomicrobiaceae bacterium]